MEKRSQVRHVCVYFVSARLLEMFGYRVGAWSQRWLQHFRQMLQIKVRKSQNIDVQTLRFECSFPTRELVPLAPGATGPVDPGGRVYPAPPAAAHVQMTAGPLMSRVRMTETGGKAAGQKNSAALRWIYGCLRLALLGKLMDFTVYEFIMFAL